MGRAGLIRTNKVYAVYYDGGSMWACGAAAWPPLVPGKVAAMYLKGTPPDASCVRPFVESPDVFPGYWEFAMLHDLLHTFGIVDPDAPNHVAAIPGHVPEPNDLMYSGPTPWVIDGSTAIDVGGDDYFGPSVSRGLVHLSNSPYLRRAPVAPPTAACCGEPWRSTPSVDVTGLPFHPPLAGTRIGRGSGLSPPPCCPGTRRWSWPASSARAGTRSTRQAACRRGSCAAGRPGSARARRAAALPCACRSG